jgi:hypothetical protein
MRDQWRELEDYYRRRRDWEDDEIARPDDDERATRKGIVSFVLALVLAPLTVGVFVLAGVLESMTPGGLKDDSPEAILVGGLGMLCLVGMVIGAILGIRGLVEPGTMKVFALLGLIGNALILVGTIGLVVLGLIFG